MPQISIGTRVKVKGVRPRTMALRQEYKEECEHNPDLPPYPGMEGRVVGYRTEKDDWPVGQLPGDPLHVVKLGTKLSEVYWYEELEVVT